MSHLGPWWTAAGKLEEGNDDSRGIYTGTNVKRGVHDGRRRHVAPLSNGHDRSTGSDSRRFRRFREDCPGAVKVHGMEPCTLRRVTSVVKAQGFEVTRYTTQTGLAGPTL